MRITKKGQVTIPIEIREKTGLLPNTEVEFKVVDGRVCIERIESTPKASVIARMKGKATVKMTTDEITRLTRG